MDRYINIKRKLSPQNTKMGNVAKINRASSSQGIVQNSNSANRFELLADTSDGIPSAVLDTDNKKARPPPLYTREKNSNNLVNIIIGLIGKDSFHVLQLTKGDIHETKVQVIAGTPDHDDFITVQNKIDDLV